MAFEGMTLESAVKDYCGYLNAKPNAWGQQLTPYGQSHHMLRIMYKTYGREKVIIALDNHYKKIGSHC